ncbi:hypothetical protein GN958_ATG15784 [Phytophthora infestans]|uniref:FYVE-type domain-containing protein n=2 Tax=Phytophthora infestans TaxID=4787 RepID=A0A8S9TMU3_PHYIN|nr:hypothetical protein GN958_ATG21031 [Phytophthora infestans]KAF4135023.1 hypothetical protein GN958_ATG15784 [Phytophthora infestans]
MADGAPFNLSTNEKASTRLKCDDEELLMAQTEAEAVPGVDFDSLSSISLDEWETGIGRHKHSKDENLRAFSRQRNPDTTKVLVMGELQCSVAEAAALLCCLEEADFNANMKRIHGHSFECGSVVRSFSSSKSDNQDEELSPYRLLKTASFKHSRLAVLDYDERWCFLEDFEPVTQERFTLSQRSVRPDALPPEVRPPAELARRNGLGFSRSSKQTHQLQSLSLGYSVEAINDRQPAAVRFLFYGCSSDERQSSDVAQRRLKRLARNILTVPELMRRRQISAKGSESQEIDRLSLKNSPSASQCVGCARKFHKLLPIKKTRCYLCAQFVCWRCWARQPLDTINGRKISVLVCPHCLDTIRNCNHARLVFSSRGSGSSASTSSHGSGGEIYRSTRIQPDVDDALEPGQAVVSYLADILSDDSEASQSDASMDSNKARKTHTAAKVLQELTSVLDEGINRVMANCFWDSDNSGALISDLTPSMPAALLKLQSQLSRELLPVEACSLSQAVTPIYPLGSSPRTPRGPIPPNEAHRLEAITQDQLLTARGSDELGLICELATQELSCLASLVTIVGKSLLHVLASSSPAFQNAEVPREQTLCQYLLMGDRPMLLQHPENDVRFCKIPLLIDNNIQFYAGFPIFSRDGLSVVGSLCCLDVRPQEMTQSQYSTLLHLTRTASSIINKKCTKPPGLNK